MAAYVKLFVTVVALLGLSPFASATERSCFSVFQGTGAMRLAPETHFALGEGAYLFRHSLRPTPKLPEIDFKSPISPSSPLLKMPNVSNAPLPKEFLAHLEGSTAAAQIRRLYGTGLGLKIGIPGYGGGANGETIQLQFIGKVVGAILPEAQYREFDRRSELPEARFTISDTFESSYASGHGMDNEVWHFEMLETKMTNPALGKVDKKGSRSSLGIPDDLVITSLSTSLYAGGKAIRGLITSIIRARPHLIIVGQASDSGIGYIENDLKGEYLGYRVIRLSELHQQKLSNTSKFIVLNDIAGRMPFVYGVSNVAVTYGGINLNEPLLAGTKTFVFGESSVGDRYDKAAFKRAISLAEATGGAHPVDSAEELTDSLRKEFAAPVQKQIIPPYLVEQTNVQSAFTRFTTKLRNILFLSATGDQKRALVSDPFLKSGYLEAVEIYLKISTQEIVEPHRTFIANVDGQTRDVLGPKLILNAIGNLTRMEPPENFREFLTARELSRISERVRRAIEALQAHTRSRDFAHLEADNAVRALEKWIQ